MVYTERIRALACGQHLNAVRVNRPFVLRTARPSPDAFAGRVLLEVGRIGKRIVLGFDRDHYAVLHLMVSGRLHWRPHPLRSGEKSAIAAFDFRDGTLLMTETSKRHRASLHLLFCRDGLAAFDRGGADVFRTTPEAFGAVLRRENRTLKRVLTDPSIVDGIGNAYSDEILHRARLSPFALTGCLDEGEVTRLHRAAVEVLTEWLDRLRREAGDGFPEKVTAFRPEMAVHGKYGRPCPVCGAPVQRVVYAENEANYCPQCQTGGRVLADRALSRLLKEDWPRTLEELERLRHGRGGP